MAAKYYAVRHGRSTGVFFTWEECQKQVTGFPGAVFKSFPTIEEAEAYVKEDMSGVVSVTKPAGRDTAADAADGIWTAKAGSRTARRNEKASSAIELLEAEPDALIAYVDGSYHSITGEFSYGMVLLLGGHAEQELTFCQKFADAELASMRNVAGEIKGAEAAMRYAVSQGFSKLYIFHDYEGIARWCRGEWKANKEGTKAYKAYYDSIQDRLQVVFVKVAAHTGDKYNEMADKLAKQALGLL